MCVRVCDHVCVCKREILNVCVCVYVMLKMTLSVVPSTSPPPRICWPVLTSVFATVLLRQPVAVVSWSQYPPVHDRECVRECV